MCSLLVMSRKSIFRDAWVWNSSKFVNFSSRRPNEALAATYTMQSSRCRDSPSAQLLLNAFATGAGGQRSVNEKNRRTIYSELVVRRTVWDRLARRTTDGAADVTWSWWRHDVAGRHGGRRRQQPINRLSDRLSVFSDRRERKEARKADTKLREFTLKLGGTLIFCCYDRNSQ